MAEAPDEIVDELYGAPFDEFIPRRDAAARELRREKRREEADAVKALRKPSLSAWAVDQLARLDRDQLDGLLAAGAALRQAKGGDALRDATHEERTAVEDATARAVEILRDAAHAVTDKTRSEVRDTLHAAALDEEARGLIAAGRLVEARAPTGFGFGTLASASASAPAREGKKARGQEGKKERQEAEAEARRAAAVSAARDALREAEGVARERERDVARAQASLDAAHAALEEARTEVEKRRRAVDDAD